MNLSFNLSDKLGLLANTLYFFKKHLMIIVGLGLISALGRVIQLEGFGQIPTWANIILEVVVESARILLFLYVLGLANIKKGIWRIRQLFTDRNGLKLYGRVALQTMKKRWLEILLNFSAFLGIAWIINYLIDLLVYQTCLYLTLKKGEILSQAASEWTVILFFKNLSVIPFTLTFEALFLLWIINKFRSYKTVGTL
jgi:hypothetical protein